MTSRMAFSNLPHYGGKVDEYKNWRFQFGQFLEEEENFVDFLEWLDNQAEELDHEAVDKWGAQHAIITEEEARWMNHQLFQCLALNCRGDALVQVQNIAKNKDERTKACRGVNAWIKLVKEHEGLSAQRLAGLVARVYDPDRAKKYNEAVIALEAWEMRVKEYEKATKQDMPDIAKVFSVKKIVPLELAKDITRLSSSLTDYKKVKAYVVEQVGERKEAWFDQDKGSSKKDHGGVQPMEIDNLNTLINQLMQLKGEEKVEEEEEGCKECGEDMSAILEKAESTLLALRGNGEQGGWGQGNRFQGNCNHCGKPGHRMSECRIKDAEMKKYREENGKGGKGGYGGQGFGKSGGKGGQKGGWNNWNYGQQGKGGYKGGYGQGNKGGKGFGKLGWQGRGGAFWFDGQTQGASEEGWQQGGGTRQLFNLNLTPPPGLTDGSRFRALQTEEDELDIPEVGEEHTGCQPKNTDTEVLAGGRKRKQPMKRVKKDEWKAVSSVPKNGHAMTFFSEPAPASAMALSSSSWMSVCPKTGWRKVKSVMDSGASDNCAPPELAPEVEIEESEGSRRGQKFSAAGGKTLENLGEKTLGMVTGGGADTVGTWQMVEVVRPLNSVRKVCKQGNRVLFGAEGGIIYNIESGEQIPFGVEDEIYTLELWLPPEGQVANGKASGFPRPGWKS